MNAPHHANVEQHRLLALAQICDTTFGCRACQFQANETHFSRNRGEYAKTITARRDEKLTLGTRWTRTAVKRDLHAAIRVVFEHLVRRLGTEQTTLVRRLPTNGFRICSHWPLTTWRHQSERAVGRNAVNNGQRPHHEAVDWQRENCTARVASGASG